MVEILENKNPIEAIHTQLLANEPKVIGSFVPSDGVAQKEAFLKGDIDNPRHTYSKLDNTDFSVLKNSIQELGQSIVSNPNLPTKHQPAYEQFTDGYLQRAELLRLAQAYNHAETDAERQELAELYMAQNIEAYGKPDEQTYRALIGERLQRITSKNLDGEAVQMRDELFKLVDFDGHDGSLERFRPSPETIEWMHGVVGSLYGGMLSHVPGDKDTFTPAEVQSIFTDIIEQEFGEATVGWTVDIEEAVSINVKTVEKRIVIPKREVMRSRSMVRKLVVHEIGVHMLRSVMGAETDLKPLASGLNDYYDSEEGLGVVMEQALESEAVDRGVDHYITAGLAYYDKKDFRGAFEVKWRLALLDKLTDDGQVMPDQIDKARTTAYAQTMRCFRGTDDLPLFKDLAYFNGSNDTWRHLEEIRGDDTRFMFVLLGKLDPSNKDHERLVYETRTV